MNNFEKLTLAHPIEIDGKTVTELKFRGIRLGDIEAISICPNEFSAMSLLASRLAAVDIDVIRNLELQDASAMADIIGEAANRMIARAKT